jgi:SdrD B-like domain
MRSLRWPSGPLLALLLASPTWAQTTYNCLPTCDPTDARFLAIANGTGLITLSQPTLDLELSVPRGTTTFTVGFFDGDARGTDLSGTPHWDQGNPATFSYTLFADPLRDHSAALVAPLSGSPFALSTAMPDNAWIDYTVNTDPSARAPSGHYFYLLRIQLLTPVSMTNAFKVRTGGALVGGSAIFPSPQPFSYIANVAGNADAAIVYPSFPAMSPTRYDGTFNFFFERPVSQRDLAVWDGDFDFGKHDGSVLDTDDPDTPGAPFRPEWATPDAISQGVATGMTGTTGNPADDRSPAGAGIYLLRPPSIFYDVIFPDGQTFRNDNPSGNQEWEQFRISTDPFDRAQMDYHADSIPPGVYRLAIQGVDLQNLNALLLPGRALCVSPSGIPCQPLYPYLLGDTVFADDNGNGVQDPGEPGIAGVILELSDAGGYPIATATTDAAGHYSFDVDAYSYTVRVPALAGYLPTTPVTCQAMITTGNVLTCDFGYRTPRSIGDRVWNDANANGVQDPGETGVDGVTVQLFDSGGALIATTTTAGDGNYTFDRLLPGTYTVRIVSGTLGGTATPTYDVDGLSSANQATVSLTASRTDVDFGYHFPASGCDGTGTLGYWKNHPSAWPVASITIGGVTYTKSQAITWLSTPVRGDESIALFQQLVPAELNALIGNSVSCITATIQAADAWMSQHPVSSGVSTSSSAGQAGAALQSRLDDYNNGRLCAPHRN